MTTDLATLAANPGALAVVDDPGKRIEIACAQACAWLRSANDISIEEIIDTRAQAAAVAAFVLQKQIGKGAELAAQEVQRRAERGLGLAIRRGQDAGEIVKRGRTQKSAVQEGRRSTSEWFRSGAEMTDTYTVTDNLTDEQYDDVIEEAKVEGNLSRSNVVRKVRGSRPSWRAKRLRRDAAAAAASEMCDEEISENSWRMFNGHPFEQCLAELAAVSPFALVWTAHGLRIVPDDVVAGFLAACPMADDDLAPIVALCVDVA